MWVCAYCETENSNNSAVCGCCGRARTTNSSKPPQKLAVYLIGISVLIALLAVALFSGGTGKNDDQRHERNVIPEATDLETKGAPKQETTADEGEKSCIKSNIIAISAGNGHIVALWKDGTVSATGRNEYGQCNVSHWKDVIAISAMGYETMALRADGTVLTTEYREDIAGWTNIVAISQGPIYTAGLKEDGTVVYSQTYHYPGDSNDEFSPVLGWKNITAISVGADHIVGLKADGTVVAAGDNGLGQCEVSGWRDIVALAAGDFCTVGLKADGTVIATEDVNGFSEWTDIRSISCYLGSGDTACMGIKSDGTVLTTEYGWLSELSGMTDIAEAAHGEYEAEVYQSNGKVEFRLCDFVVVRQTDGRIRLWSTNNNALLDGVFDLNEL